MSKGYHIIARKESHTRASKTFGLGVAETVVASKAPNRTVAESPVIFILRKISKVTLGIGLDSWVG